MMFSRWTGKGRARHGRGVLLFLLLATAWLTGGPAWAAGIVAVTARPASILIRFDAPIVGASAAVERAGRRIVVDLPDVSLAAGARSVPSLRGGFATMRAAARPTGGARLAFDLPGTAVVSDGLLEGDGRSLTLSLAQVDAAAATEAGMGPPLSFLPFHVDLGGSRARYHVSQAVPPATRAAALPRIAGDRSRPLVVIDPGHGGVDPGAINPENGLREKDVTLKIARAIRDELVAGGRVRVALTRDDDRFLVLRERYGIARRLHADLFISIHCDSVGGGSGASGASVYTLSEVASDKEAARLAARENKADVLSGVDLGGTGADVSTILIDLTQRETMNSSADFARLLGREAAPLMPLRAQFHRMASLMVLKAPDMPSVLLETGYISNPRDAAFLDSKEGQHKVAEAIERAVAVHFARRVAAK